jgi:molybdopterin converting factor small subunit
MKIHVVITGRSYHTTSHLPEELMLAEPAQVDDAIARLSRLLPAGQGFPPSCLVAVAGRHLGTIQRHEACPLRDGDELTLIAPVAGG